MNLNLRFSTILLVLFVFSKEILVFNEEILVLFTFFVFIYLTYSFASSLINLTLDARALRIQEEFLQYRQIQQNTINYLISYHKKQKELSKNITEIFIVTKDSIRTILLNYSNLFVKNILLQIEEKLKKVLANESKYNLLLQSRIIDELNSYLIVNYSSIKGKKNREAFMLNAFFSLSNLYK